MEQIEKYCKNQNIKADNLNYVFQIACREGHLDMVKFLLGYAEMNNLKIDIDANVNHAFIFTCGNGHLDVAKFLLEYAEMNNLKIDIDANGNHAFIFACGNGHLEMVKFLLSLSTNELVENASFGKVEENDSSFKNAKINNLEIDIHVNGDYAFVMACGNGHLPVVKFLLGYAKENGAEIDINAYEGHAFRLACGNGHLDMAKFLLEYAEMNNLEIDIHADREHAFQYTCENGHLDVVEFLLEYAEINNLKIDLNAREDFAFRCCRNEEIINLLLPLLNRNKDEFYFYKEEEYYILKPLDFEMDSPNTKFEHFQVYHKKATYIDDCIEAYQVYLRQFRKKSAFSTITDR